MQILTWPSDAAVPIGEFGSQAAAAFPLASGSGEAHAYVVFLAPGGVIGPHPAGFGQLFVPLAGTGWWAPPPGGVGRPGAPGGGGGGGGGAPAPPPGRSAPDKQRASRAARCTARAATGGSPP